ncbi:hypothetical protein TREMEDRAFT_29267 [Tremella mesenterica DSM 1558]|uniref:uncharacterized protein n=1 Tax=Tremella mesenterica (strain ATCC 24925 / CBS 8224 / DSM 1558 / NBRC 9311 / NRRL Y-6157 / RJB 2259-6 / UBC 559-6) TaxID=578456 RepID=UPI0003F48EC3|nr:uncharacterized protein TREMEDRAFT_29267 [Tremella mesenterica DSM 1558]EIW70875.1 hypothetical protein TREMEDRAFT_29267 [Tremella mesenterica DSM 1558]
MSSHSHMMKTTRRGRPFVKDIHDLFSTLFISLELGNHRSFFKTYPYSFTTDEAAENLSSLKFSQSQRSADPKDPSRIITTTTTTTFSMTREMARGILQQLLDAHLIENGPDLPSTTFKERGIFMATPKGLHILERFITKNGISADNLLLIFAHQPIAMKLLHLERRSQDDEIIITKSVIEVLFRRFLGIKEPNLVTMSDDDLQKYNTLRWYNKGDAEKIEELDRSLGMPLRKAQVQNGKSTTEEYQFSAILAAEWLLDYSTCVGLDEAAEIAAHFVRYGLIALVSDKGKVKDGNTVQEAEFRATDKAIYRITKDGLALAKWSDNKTSNPSATISKPNLHSADSTTSTQSLSKSRASHSTEDSRATESGNLTRRPSLSGNLREGGDEKDVHLKDSHTARLKQILEEPALRSLFREFLRVNFCEENLSFWLDVQDLKRRFNTTSSAVAAPSGKGKPATQAMEKHHQELIAMAFVIYNTFLAPASPCELNIDHNLRAELISYMNQVTTDKEAAAKGQMSAEAASTMHASQIQTMVKLYERIQGYIFRLMATDSVPKFCKTERFLNLMRTVFDYNEKFEDPDNLFGPAKGVPQVDDVQPSPTRAYMTISQVSR